MKYKCEYCKDEKRVWVSQKHWNRQPHTFCNDIINCPKCNLKEEIIITD